MALRFISPQVEESSILTPDQLNGFYNVMKKAVWKVEVRWKSKNTQANSVGGIYTGVCIDKEGLILTRYFDPSCGDATVHGPSDQQYSRADFVFGDSKIGLALVQAKHRRKYDFVDFSPERKFDVGKQVYSIVFPKPATCSIILTGHLAYHYDPDYESPEDNLDKYRTMSRMPPEVAYQHSATRQNVISDNVPTVGQTDLAGHVSFLQIAKLGATTEYQGRNHNSSEIMGPELNQFGLDEGRGAPVFDAIGRLIGLVMFQFIGFDLAIHVDHLKEFRSKYSSSSSGGQSKDSKRYGKEKVGTSGTHGKAKMLKDNKK